MKIIYHFSWILFALLFSCAKPEEQFSDKDFAALGQMVQEMQSEGRVIGLGLDTLAAYYQEKINAYDSLENFADYSRYKFVGPNSTNLPEQDSSLSSIVIFQTTPDREKALKEVAMTNFLDEKFVEFYHKYELAVQVYSNSAMQVSRVYPTYDHKNILDPNLDVTSFNFYYAADQVNNPSKQLVWIPDAYVDPAGKGWILSLVHPIYLKDELFAVLGVDLTVDEIVHTYLEKFEGEFLLVNGKGDIIGGKARAIELVNMPPLKNHVYRETVKSDNFRISDFNLYNSKSKEVRAMAQEFLLKKADRFIFQEEQNINRAICKPFSGIDWFLIQIYPAN